MALDVAPHRHDRVADELVERTLMFEDDRGHRAQIFVQLSNERFWLSLFADRREISNVREKNHRLPAHAADCFVVSRWILQNFVYEVPRNVPFQCAARADSLHPLQRKIET